MDVSFMKHVHEHTHIHTDILYDLLLWWERVQTSPATSCCPTLWCCPVRTVDGWVSCRGKGCTLSSLALPQDNFVTIYLQCFIHLMPFSHHTGLFYNVRLPTVFMLRRFSSQGTLTLLCPQEGAKVPFLIVIIRFCCFCVFLYLNLSTFTLIC